MTSGMPALQQELAEARRALEAERQRRTLFEQLYLTLPVGVAIWQLRDPADPRSLTLVSANPTSLTHAMMDLDTDVGRRMVEIYPTVPLELLQTYAQVIVSGQPLNLGELTFEDENGGPPMAYELQAFPLPDHHICIVHAEVSDRKRAEEALRQSISLEETIRAQNVALAELSTPLIPITDEVMVMPLIGTVDSRRAQQVMEALLEGIAAQGAETVILDITGVPVVDTQVADALIRSAQAVKLLGASVILTGIRPEVAQTLIGLGADLGTIITMANLQSGIAYATGS